MKRRTKGLFYLLGFIAFLICLLVVRPAWQARRPSDMPRNSIWIEAPAVPFGFYRGWWLGCWIDSDHISNRCRFWSSGGLGVVYEGRYISCDNKSPVRADELQLSPQAEVNWVGYSQGDVFAPAVDLWNGKVLVPSAAPRACEELEKQKNQR